ncbi:MAG: hypothetical protein KDK76_04575 [Chlamydiia bacterium]|nr:hypothetical protein [Chlamydiia bacterium]
MKRAIFPLVTFMIAIMGVVYYYPKLNHIRMSNHTFLHDRPVACEMCGSMMWDGPQAHSCTDLLEETN